MKDLLWKREINMGLLAVYVKTKSEQVLVVPISPIADQCMLCLIHCNKALPLCYCDVQP